ncbi:MAG TPA: hypothetical protein VFO27_07015, partial [Bryobacteraceae bacterium]|nr:hypothetical protein [Bryobacteraceae bacterium]
MCLIAQAEGKGEPEWRMAPVRTVQSDFATHELDHPIAHRKIQFRLVLVGQGAIIGNGGPVFLR